MDAFKMFDIDQRGVISDSDIKYGLADIGVNVDMEDVRLFVRRYDRDGDGMLSYHEFADAMTP